MKGGTTDGIHLEWTRGETIFAVVAMLIVAMNTFGFDKLFFRSKTRQTRPPDPRKYRIGYIVEEEDEQKKDKNQK